MPVRTVVRYVILFFYPFDFTFVCPTEIMAFNSVVDDLRAKGAEVLGISTDSVHSHLAYRRLEPSQGGAWAWLGMAGLAGMGSGVTVQQFKACLDSILILHPTSLHYPEVLRFSWEELARSSFRCCQTSERRHRKHMMC